MLFNLYKVKHDLLFERGQHQGHDPLVRPHEGVLHKHLGHLAAHEGLDLLSDCLSFVRMSRAKMNKVNNISKLLKKKNENVSIITIFTFNSKF